MNPEVSGGVMVRRSEVGPVKCASLVTLVNFTQIQSFLLTGQAG